MSVLTDVTRTDLNTVVGTELPDTDLRGLDDDGIDAISQLVAERGVIFFRNQKMTLTEQVEFGARLGELHVHPAAKAPDGFPEVLLVHTDENSKFTAGDGWHTDVSCDARPPGLSMLRIEQTPPTGGDTMWSSMYEAFETLSTSMQEYLLTLTAVHRGDVAYRGRYSARKDDVEYPVSEHPVVRTHPRTGRRALYVNSGFTDKIKQLTRKESDALLAMLYDHIAYGVRFQVRFHWEPDSVAIWDNRCVQHHASWDYFPETRHGYRVTTVGEAPYLEI